MSRDLFGLSHIRQLDEIQNARLRKTGEGIGREVQVLIDQLTSGGVAPLGDIRVTQAKVLWNRGWGRERGITTFEEYLNSIPLAPERPAGMPNCFRPVLWDLFPLFREKGKTPRVSITKACQLLGVAFSGDDETFVNHEATPEITDPVYWVWCQGGRRNRGKAPRDCRKVFTPPEVSLEAIGGLFLYAQDPTVIGREGDFHIMDLLGSVRRKDPSSCACLRVLYGEPRLFWRSDDSAGAGPRCGSASRGE
ncbi:MAG: hypothetical protein Q8R32_01455 [bacterium]|nr:hypothetical protein [bacterium]